MIIDPLHIDTPELVHEKFRRIIMLDPAPIYNRIYDKLRWFSHYQRYNTVFSDTLFPQEDKKICACGCGEKLPPRNRRWATPECKTFSFYTTQIISGRSEQIRTVLSCVYEERCFICGRTEKDFPVKTAWPDRDHYKTVVDYEKAYNRHIYECSRKIHLDHIIPVHQGGGCGWLSNYQFLCIECHKEKSKKDRK